MRIDFYDTTLRDGAQSEDIAFSVNDKLRVTEKLDEFGMDFIEGGWPGSNPRDLEYFEEVKKCRLTHARIVAFSSTMKAGALSDPEGDEIMQSLLRAETEYVAIVGKSWDLHVRDALRVSLDTNLQDDRADNTLPEGARQDRLLRRRAFLRRVQGQQGVCGKGRQGRGRRGGRRGRAVRHERGQHAFRDRGRRG